jgi:hypothetical protein
LRIAVTWANPSTVIGAAALEVVTGRVFVWTGPVADWMGEGVGLIIADLGGGVACASEETAKTVPVIRTITENLRLMVFLPEGHLDQMNCRLHVYWCLALNWSCCASRLLMFVAAMLPAAEAADSIPFQRVESIRRTA